VVPLARTFMNAVITMAQSTSPGMVAAREANPHGLQAVVDAALELEAVLSAAGFKGIMHPTDAAMMTLLQYNHRGQQGPETGG
jgi:hypothetical protein